VIELLLDNRDLFITGFLNTILLFVLAGIGALLLGTLLAAMRVSPVPWSSSRKPSGPWCRR